MAIKNRTSKKRLPKAATGRTSTKGVASRAATAGKKTKPKE